LNGSLSSSAAGKQFQTRGPATANDLSPSHYSDYIHNHYLLLLSLKVDDYYTIIPFHRG